MAFMTFPLVRTLRIDGEPWFVGRDVAEPLGYGNPAEAIRDHCKSAKSLKSLSSNVSLEAGVFNEFPGNTLLIREPDVYRVALRSKLPAAEQFEPLGGRDGTARRS